MELENLHSFLEKAGERVTQTRSGLLVIGQNSGLSDDLAICAADLDSLQAKAQHLGLDLIGYRLAECVEKLKKVYTADSGDITFEVNQALDKVASVEAALLEIPLSSGEFLDDVSGFVDASFENLDGGHIPIEAEEDFEMDEETMEIFRGEADELLAGISENLRSLAASPNDSHAIWEIRRNAHTFKGAAGIVGLKMASQLAHSVEDLLDKMVELECGADGSVIDLLNRSHLALNAFTAGTASPENIPKSADFYNMIKSLSGNGCTSNVSNSSNRSSGARDNAVKVIRPPSTPIVRISLDRLDELINASQDLVNNRTLISAHIETMGSKASDEDFRGLESLFETQRQLADQIREKLLRIRMVRFGTLETRLSRAVHVTCQDENKRAVVEIINPDIEIDTQIIDALIEPLLHLLKNAVVHGIEAPDTRRLIGKPESGLIAIGISTDANDVIISVEDDGRGISALRLKEKAIETGLINAETASQMADFETWELIFDRGLTTADKLNLNAGRGIGMNIVRESVESHGGSVSLSTEPQIGTTFTIRLPLVFKKSRKSVETSSEVGEKTKPLVLIVDDSASVRRHHVKLIEEAGCQAITANDGSEALILLLSGKWEPDLILSDVEMPNMDGWELLEYIKTDSNFGSIPVVLATSLNTEEHITKAAELKASEYKIKPLEAKDVTSILRILNEQEVCSA